MERTVRCPFCGDLYVFYSYSSLRQDACPRCIQEANYNLTADMLMAADLLRARPFPECKHDGVDLRTRSDYDRWNREEDQI